jgi:hypothetical protein
MPGQAAGGAADHHRDMPELDPAAVIGVVTRDPRLRAFTGHGRIETLPARQARRHLLLDKIAQAFEPGVRYSERQVSLFLGALHADYAALRRYLVDEEFLSRSGGQYWRSGGTVLPPPPDEPGIRHSPPGADSDPAGESRRGDERSSIRRSPGGTRG